MVNVVFDYSAEIRSMLMNADQGSGETKTLVYAGNLTSISRTQLA